MQEISEFFDQLDPDIDVIWGTSTDNSLGEDAKVIILAADMSDGLSTDSRESVQEDDYYEQLIAELYKPLRQPTATAPVEDPHFEVEKAPEPEPAIEPETEPAAAVEQGQKSRRTTTMGRWRNWLNKKLGEIIYEEE